MTLREELAAMAEEEYRAFSARLLPPGTPLLGVRLPRLRKQAKKIARGDWRAFLANRPADAVFEETMLRGMVIGYAEASLPERLGLIAAFLPEIDNWSVCDSFISGLKFIRENREPVWEFLAPYLASEKEFPARFAVVTLLFYYLEDGYYKAVLERLAAVRAPNYYARMAVAWAAAECFVRYPGPTRVWLETRPLDEVTMGLTVRKIMESRAVSPAAKADIRRLKGEAAT